MKIVIAGGGIGGLAAALALHDLGIDAEVYEQSLELRELGVGINILPHAVKELASLGLLPALLAAGVRTRELVYTNRLGQTVWRELRYRCRLCDASVQHPSRQAPWGAAPRRIGAYWEQRAFITIAV